MCIQREVDRVTGVSAFVGACLLVFLVAALYEVFKHYREEHFHQYLAAADCNCPTASSGKL